MKQFYASLFLALFFVTSGHAQSNCNAGYESPTFANTQSVPANTIFTITVTASSAGTLTGISFYNTGMSTANIKCCVYDDAAGLPGNLIASTSVYQATSTAGPVTLTVTPVFIPAGTYHLGAVIDMGSDIIPIDNTVSATLYAYPSPFANPFPPSGSSFISTNGNPVNIWMNITCSAAGIDEHDNSGFSMTSFPVPAGDLLTLHFAASGSMEINETYYNSCGALVLEKKTSLVAGDNSETQDITSFSPGIYFLRITDATGTILASQKVIKQ